MILISRLASGALLLQKDETEIVIDQAAIGTALPGVLLTLIDTSHAIGQARREGHEDGLTLGYARGVAETEARHQREAEQIAASLSLLRVSAPMAA